MANKDTRHHNTGIKLVEPDHGSAKSAAAPSPHLVFDAQSIPQRMLSKGNESVGKKTQKIYNPAKADINPNVKSRNMNSSLDKINK